MVEEEKKTTKRTRGARNLMIMGLASILIAMATTGVSMAIYHKSGDIYLDRSRPGFLPDESEIEEDDNDDEENEYDFSKTGSISKESLGEYLKNLDKEEKAINVYGEPFNDKALSDDHLGISPNEGGQSAGEGMSE